jgi:hypothetical protein
VSIKLPLPLSSPLPLHFQAEPVLTLSLILLKRRQKDNKEDKTFLLVKDRYREILSITSMYKCFITQVDSSLTDLYTAS